MNSHEQRAVADPLDAYDLDLLTRGAARLRGGRLALRDSSGDMFTFAELDARADAIADQFAAHGLGPGATLMIHGGAAATTCLALIGALRAGLDVAMAPLHAPARTLATMASLVDARAIVAPTRYGDLAPIETAFEIAVLSQDITLVFNAGPDAADGAVDLCSEALRGGAAARRRPGRIATLASGGGVAWRSQRTLVAAALDVATRARLGMGAGLLSTIAPTSYAGLVAGPVLALMIGASLRLHGPFDAAFFTEDIEALSPAVLVAPGALAASLAEANLIRPERLAALLLLDRTTEARGALAPLGDTAGVTVVDLHAFDEQAVIAERRGPDGRPLPAAREPHMIMLDNREILAVRRREGPGPLRFEGAAVGV